MHILLSVLGIAVLIVGIVLGLILGEVNLMLACICLSVTLAVLLFALSHIMETQKNIIKRLDELSRRLPEEDEIL